MSAPTAEGVLYEIDLRLRPSGNKGPVATHIDAFRKYQREDADVWEHMALTRARALAGDADFRDGVMSAVEEVLSVKRDRAKVAREARQMRALIEQEKPPADAWDIKLIPGGLIDLEFIAQVAVLTGQTTGRLGTATADVLANLAPGFCDPQISSELAAAHGLYTTVTQILRLCLTGRFDAADVPPGLADILTRATDLPDMKVLEAHLKETSQRVRKHFDALLRAKG